MLSEDERWELWNAHGVDEMSQKEADAFARAIEAAVLAKLQAQSEPVPKGVLLALSNAGLMLIKTQHGYEVRKLGKITAQAAPVQQDVNKQLLEALKECLLHINYDPTGDVSVKARAAIAQVEGKHD